MCSAGVFFASKLTCWVLCGASSTGAREAMFSMVPLDDALLRLVGHDFNGGLNSNVGGIGLRQRKIGGDQRIFQRDRAGGGEKNLLPDAGVAIANRGNPVPADGAEKGGAVDGGDAAVLADAVAQGVFVRNAGMRLRRDEHGDDGLLAGLYLRGDVEDAADERAAHRADLHAVDPDFGGVVDAVEVEPDMAILVGAWEP